MCGIAGYVGKTSSPDHCLSEMINAIKHRGPDDSGVWFDKNAGIGLGHVRLSILDCFRTSLSTLSTSVLNTSNVGN